MESFGLANFLQSLLKLTNPAEQQSLSSEPTESAKEPPHDEPTTPPNASTDAVLRFMQTHDERARKFKR